MPADGSSLFDPIFGSEHVRPACDDSAWLAAMLEVEVALAAAEARVGVITADDAAAIASGAASVSLDPAIIGSESVAGGNPVIPLVSHLRTAAAEFGAPSTSVHRGATSQDILDTALVLIARRAGRIVVHLLADAADAAREIAVSYSEVAMVARTLGQQALPTTVGATAAGWALALAQTARDLTAVLDELPVQFGGAAGTLAALHPHGLAVADELAAELGLPSPSMPWHTRRRPVARLAGAAAASAGAVEKVATDIVLMAATEVGEVSEAASGGSSAMPHKQNPVAAITARAAARRTLGPVAVLLSCADHEFARAAGAWHAEWQAVTDLFTTAGGAAARLRDSLRGLHIHSDAMRDNLDATGGMLLAERVVVALGDHIENARAVVTDAARNGRRLDTDPAITAHLSPTELADLLDPSGYLGHAQDLAARGIAETVEILTTLSTTPMSPGGAVHAEH